MQTLTLESHCQRVLLSGGFVLLYTVIFIFQTSNRFEVLFVVTCAVSLKLALQRKRSLYLDNACPFILWL